MLVPVTCHCGKTFRVKEERIGHAGKCPACGVTITVPFPTSANASDGDPELMKAWSENGGKDGVIPFDLIDVSEEEESPPPPPQKTPTPPSAKNRLSCCSKCGAKRGPGWQFTGDLMATEFLCDRCRRVIAAELAMAAAKEQAEERARRNQFRRDAAHVIVTTTPEVDGMHVVAYLGIESVEYVIGTGIFSEITSDIADMFGARSTAFENKLQKAKQVTLDVLKYRAAEKGANAVIGIDMDYAEFSGNRVALIINGTLVKLEKLDK